MKVLFVINSLAGGGAERSLVEMLPRLAENGWEAIVACLRRADGFEDEVLATGCRARFVRARRFPGRIQELGRVVSEHRPDLIHTAIFESDVAGRVAGRRAGVPVLTSLVNTSYAAVRLADPNVRPWKLRLVREIDGWTGRRWNCHFHAISNTVRDHAIEQLRISPDRITVIPRGRDEARLGEPSADRRRASRRRLGISSGSKVLVNVGRQEFQKGQAHLLQAAARLIPQHSDLLTLIVGRRGNASEGLEAMHRRLGLGGRVRFLGHRDDVADILAAADVFVFPSLFEGLGGSLIEAMALGVPIVASDLPAVREVVDEGENALLVAPEPDALARAVDGLIRDVDRRKRFEAHGRRIFAERFRLSKVVDRTISLYREVAGNGEHR